MTVVEIGGRRYRGRAIDLRASGAGGEVGIDAVTLSMAIRGEADRVTVHCPDPSPVHERVGFVRPGRSYPIRAALATAARVLGLEASVDSELAEVREELSATDPPGCSTMEERRRVAEAEGSVVDEPAAEPAGETAERVAELRGRIEAARDGDSDEDVDELRADLQAAAASMAERRTDRIAAEQALSHARQRARNARDRRERRLELQDRERNLEREARRELAAAIEPAFERALAAVPGDCQIGPRPGTVDGDEVTAALAVCRIAPLSAPVVVACDRFPSATAAAAALDAPVILADE